MKKLMMLLVVIGLAFSVTAAVANSEEPEEDKGSKMDKVAICNLGNEAANFLLTGRGCGCLDDGGAVVVVSKNACGAFFDEEVAIMACEAADNVGAVDTKSCREE